MKNVQMIKGEKHLSEDTLLCEHFNKPCYQQTGKGVGFVLAKCEQTLK